MTSFEYARMAATARRLLNRFGQAVTITRTAPNGAVSTRPAIGVVASTVKHTLGDSNISIGDDKLYLDAAAAPEPGDRISYSGSSRVIVDPVIPLAPAGIRVLVECYARAG